MRTCKILTSSVLAGMLAACGGGGSSGGSAGSEPSAMAFAFPAATAERAASPAVAQYVVSGDCTGAEVKLRGVASPATFGAQAASAVTTTTDRLLANCASAGSTSSWQTGFYDSAFLPIGDDNSSGAVAVSDSPWHVPTAVKPGDTGDIGAQTIYADSNRTKVLYHATFTFVVQPDTPTTALAVVTATDKDPSGNVLFVEKDSYQLRPGAWSLLSVDQQYATTSNLHLIYTPGTAAINVPAGSTVTLAAGQLLLVPAGTSVSANGNTSNLLGQLGTIVAPTGAVVTVPATAAGPADNVVMAR
ncbi:hypothetical protein ACPWT1_08135 [Ramlibacter sp. MMS24-I3-19]|uniref:hypothetical protein n=1 Tax=Ramlibacter sp. MMS24-I3-19 TaxID=3416606 RepID=UPI003D0908B5